MDGPAQLQLVPAALKCCTDTCTRGTAHACLRRALHHAPPSHRYLESVTSCSRRARLGPCTAVGAGSAIAEGSLVSYCVIGRGCSIGKNCRLSGCYLQARGV
jgi:UDP-3-O-[3-hydroxymyristoyl] glucosamine N-acyltransferase